MALSKDVDYKGLAVPGAYITVDRPTLSTSKEGMEFGVVFRAGAEAPILYLEMHTAPYTLGPVDPFEQAYLYLKTLPEFEGSTDC